MAEIVYISCAVTSCLCAFLLLRGFLVARTQLLLWSAVCFVGLAVNNLLLYADLVLFPDTRMLVVRNFINFLSVTLLVFGLIRDTV